MDFPFHDPEHVAVFTCVHVLEHNDNICYVYHDEEDGAWQFLCKQEHRTSDGRIISLKEAFLIDSSIGGLAELPLGCGVMRENKLSPWERV